MKPVVFDGQTRTTFSQPCLFPSTIIMLKDQPPTPTTVLMDDQAFENTSTSVAASQMRNALNNLADTVTDPAEKKVSSLRTNAYQKLWCN